MDEAGGKCADGGLAFTAEGGLGGLAFGGEVLGDGDEAGDFFLEVEVGAAVEEVGTFGVF